MSQGKKYGRFKERNMEGSEKEIWKGQNQEIPSVERFVMPGPPAGWKPFRRRTRNFLRRLNLAKKQNSEADKMKKKTDAAASAKKMDSKEKSTTEKVLGPGVEGSWEEVKLDEMGQMEEVKVDKMEEVEQVKEERVDLAPWCDHPQLEYWGGSWSVYCWIR